MKTLFLSLSTVFLLAASTPAGACHHGAGYSAAPTTIAPTATTIAIILTFVIGRRAASSAE